MSETLGGSDDSRTRLYFDAIDKAHELLENHKDLSKAIPSCVVVGMQSVGKSAVLSRLSGIPFPQDSEVCTRVAMELRLRRCNGSDKNSMNIAAGTTAVPVDPSSNESIENALKKAQNDVLQGRKFEDKISVKIDKVGPDLPEVTLVDLPGVFFAKTDDTEDLERKVKDMIAQRVNNKMALICHVVPLNQDTDTISTWRTVHDADKDQSRTISILTKADLALKDGRESLKSRIEKIVGESKSSECFIIHGAAKGCVDEENELSTVTDYIEELGMADRVLVGAKELTTHIEVRMLSHIKERIPEMKRLLDAELRICQAGLAEIGREAMPPLSIAMRDSDAILTAIQLAYINHRPKQRKLTEKMSDNIFNVNMQPLGLVDFEESKEKLCEHWDHNKHNPRNDKHYGLHALAMEVEQLEEDTREHLNVPFVGKEPALVRWVEQFCKPCVEITETYVEDAFKMFLNGIVRPSLDGSCSDATKPLARKLDSTVMVIISDKLNEALARVREVCTGVKQNLFTTNSHYLVETADVMKIEHSECFNGMESSYKSYMKPHFDTVYSIQGFLKSRKKFVPEAVQLNTLRILEALLEEVQASVKGVMLEESSLELIKEPASLERKRKRNLEREKQINKAMAAIRFL